MIRTVAIADILFTFESHCPAGGKPTIVVTAQFATMDEADAYINAQATGMEIMAKAVAEGGDPTEAVIAKWQGDACFQCMSGYHAGCSTTKCPCRAGGHK